MWWSASSSAPTKVRPAVVIASVTYLAEPPGCGCRDSHHEVSRTPGTTDYVLQDWQSAGLRAESCFRAYVLTVHRSELTVIGHLSGRDWESVKARVRAAFAI